MRIRSQLRQFPTINFTQTARNPHILNFQAHHYVPGGSWSLLFEDGSFCETVGFSWDEDGGWALEECRKAWGTDLDLHTLADFIKNTLIGLERGDDYLEDLLEE